MKTTKTTATDAPDAPALRDLSDDEIAARYATADDDEAAQLIAEMKRRDKKAAQHARDAARWAAVYDQWFPGAHVNYLAAEAACNGNLVNKAHAEDITDPFSLWTGSDDWAIAAATDELKEFWDANPRVTISQYRAGLRADRKAAREAAGK